MSFTTIQSPDFFLSSLSESEDEDVEDFDETADFEETADFDRSFSLSSLGSGRKALNTAGVPWKYIV